MNIKLQKTTAALRGVSADYEWEDQVITKDNCSGYWYCEPLYKGIQFDTLKDVRKALEIYLENNRVKPSLIKLNMAGINV